MQEHTHSVSFPPQINILSQTLSFNINVNVINY